MQHILYLVTAFLILFDPGDAQSGKTSRQQSCSESPNKINPQLKSALCLNHFPNNRNALSREVIDLTIHMASLSRVSSSMIKNLQLEELNGLRLTKCNIDQVDVDTLASLQYLKEVDFSENKLKSIPEGFFENNQMIIKVIFRDNQLESLDSNLFSKMQSLNYLDLSGNRLSVFPTNLPPTVTQLYLASNRIEQITLIRKLPNLQHLNLCQNNLNSFDANVIGCQKLHSLCLSNKPLQQKTFQGFDQQLPELQELMLTKIQGSKTLSLKGDVLESIGGCKKLRTLKIQEYDVQSLSILTRLEQLETLILNEVYVQETVSASYFQRLVRLSNVDLSRSQNLAGLILSDYEIRLALQKVKYLTLKNCAINDLDWVPQKSYEETTSPAPLPSLTKVELSGNTVECENDRIKEALCRFDNLRAKGIDPDTDPSNPESRVINNPRLMLENSDGIMCRQPLNANQSISQMNFGYCQEKYPIKDKPSGWPNFPPSIPINGDSEGRTPATPGLFKGDEEGEGHGGGSNVGYIILGILLCILLIVAVVLFVMWIKKRKAVAVSVEHGDQSTQSFSKLQQTSSSQNNLVDS